MCAPCASWRAHWAPWPAGRVSWQLAADPSPEASLPSSAPAWPTPACSEPAQGWRPRARGCQPPGSSARSPLAGRPGCGASGRAVQRLRPPRRPAQPLDARSGRRPWKPPTCDSAALKLAAAGARRGGLGGRACRGVIGPGSGVPDSSMERGGVWRQAQGRHSGGTSAGPRARRGSAADLGASSTTRAVTDAGSRLPSR